ncbi:hypothetical protein [uncultured Desulfobacter sp.]|uniref:hypothetical protein n=1 Tax=uncultured Desulfobacter sp. TaxID=240139 RepID=UPI0029F57AC3|nr:hypothetical protein [uncultured Desulfobacter sp.]
MGGSRNQGPMGLTDAVQDINDGTMIRGLSSRPGPVGTDPAIMHSGSASAYVNRSNVDLLLQRLRAAISGEELQRIAVALLGQQCFSAGVVAGIGLDILSSAKELIKLVGIFVLADLYDLRTGNISWWKYADLTTALRLLSSKLAGSFFQKELREAAAEKV